MLIVLYVTPLSARCWCLWSFIAVNCSNAVQIQIKPFVEKFVDGLVV